MFAMFTMRCTENEIRAKNEIGYIHLKTSKIVRRMQKRVNKNTGSYYISLIYD